MLPAAKRLMAIMPFLFGIGFIAPLIAQLLRSSGLATTLGVAPVACGLALGGAWGAIANLRGRWL